MKAQYSKKNSRGHLWVDCAECARGGNGADPNNQCSSGWQVKEGGLFGCYIGTLLPDLRLMMNETDLTIIKRFLEEHYVTFQEFLEERFEMEPTEAEVIIGRLEVEE